MPWFRVVDGFHAHRKVARLGRADFDADGRRELVR